MWNEEKYGVAVLRRMSKPASSTGSTPDTDTIDWHQVWTDYDWLGERGQSMVVGTDLDALLSASFMKTHADWEVIGFYDLESVYVDPTRRDELGEAIWLDLDVVDPDVRSVGHHILSSEPDDDLPGLENSINPNEMRGVYSSGRFTEKYPLGTIHLLYSLNWPHGELGESHSYQQMPLLWLADSAWINGQSHKYEDNVREWAGLLDTDLFENTVDHLDSEAFEHAMEQAIDDLTVGTCFENVSTSYRSKHLGVGGGQCRFDPTENQVDRHIVCARIAERMGWEEPRIIDEFEEIAGTRETGSYGDIEAEYGDLATWVEAEDVFSYAFTYRGSLNYTTGISW